MCFGACKRDFDRLGRYQGRVASRETAEAGRVNFANPRPVELKGLSEPVEIVSVAWT